MCALVLFVSWLLWQSMSDRFWNEETRTWLASGNEKVYLYFQEKITREQTPWDFQVSEVMRAVNSFLIASLADV